MQNQWKYHLFIALICSIAYGAEEVLDSNVPSEDVTYYITTPEGLPAGTIVVRTGSLTTVYNVDAIVAPQSIHLDAQDSFNAAITSRVGQDLDAMRAITAPAQPGEVRIARAGNLLDEQLVFYVMDAVAPPGFVNNERNVHRESELRSVLQSIVALASTINAHVAGASALRLAFPEMIDQSKAWTKNLRAIIDLQVTVPLQTHLERALEALKAVMPQKLQITEPKALELRSLLTKGIAEELDIELFPINSIGMPILGGGNANYPIEDSVVVTVPVLVESLQAYAVRLAQLKKEAAGDKEIIEYLEPLTIILYLYGTWNPTPARALPVLCAALDSNPYAKRL